MEIYEIELTIHIIFWYLETFKLESKISVGGATFRAGEQITEQESKIQFLIFYKISIHWKIKADNHISERMVDDVYDLLLFHQSTESFLE